MADEPPQPNANPRHCWAVSDVVGLDIFEQLRDLPFRKVSPSNVIGCVSNASHTPGHCTQVREKFASLRPKECMDFLNLFGMSVVVLRPLRQCRDASFKEFASV